MRCRARLLQNLADPRNPPMYIPSPPPTDPSPATGSPNGEPVGELGAPDGPKLELFGSEGLVSPDAPPPVDTDPDDTSSFGRALFLLLAMAGAAALVRGVMLLSAAPSLPDNAFAQGLLVAQWLVGTLLVVPVGYCVQRLTGRVTPAVLAGLVFSIHPDVLNATLSLDGVFWALPPVAIAAVLLFGLNPRPVDGSRPVPGVGASAAAGVALGLGGLAAAPVAALALPLAIWRLVRGLGCPGSGRGPRDLVSALLIVAAAAIPLTAHHAATGNDILLQRFASPHGEVIPRLIENRWPTLQARLGLTPGLNLIEEVADAFAGPPPESAFVHTAPSLMREPGIVDAIARHSWTGLNAVLLCGCFAAAGLAVHRRRGALGLMMLLAVPAAVVAGDVSGEHLRLALLPLQLLMLGVFWLPPRRFRRVSAVFNDQVKDAGFAIRQNTARVL